MAATFGLDFGTTNSLISEVRHDGQSGRLRAYPYTHRLDRRPHPSVVWYHGNQPIVGRDALEMLEERRLGVFGDIVRSPKMFLDSKTGIFVGGTARPAAEIVADVLRYLREDAIGRKFGDNPFVRANITIPVTMRGPARANLREAARMAGITIHQFVHEPLSALYGYLRGQPDFKQMLADLEGQMVLVFDWGGGTLDLTLCELRNGILAQVRNLGDDRVGGDRFDERLNEFVRRKHEEQYPGTDWNLLSLEGKRKLIHECENAKIELSSYPSTTVFVANLLETSGPEKNLAVTITRSEFEEEVRDLVTRGLNRIDALFESVGIQRGGIAFCLATGGMVSMPAIYEGLQNLIGLHLLKVPENSATVISEGAAWLAHDDVRLRLAKPIEILHANNSYAEVFSTDRELPVIGEEVVECIDMYCVDPGDGVAKFLFARPAWPGEDAHGDPRIPYALLCLPVDPSCRPLVERLQIEVAIDQNLIAEISATSLGTGEARQKRIHDLEFGIYFGEESNAKREIKRRCPDKTKPRHTRMRR